jgi:hypothetical protein
MRTHCIASTLARFESSGFLPVEAPKTIVYLAPVGNEKALHNSIVDACQITLHYIAFPGSKDSRNDSRMWNISYK